jgi:5-bromo-4-chloroindolyl phosphate hydrolysis protein
MIKNKFAELINVKTLVTFVVTGVFAALALRGTIAPDVVMTIVTMVISFYFGTQHEKQLTKEENDTTGGQEDADG